MSYKTELTAIIRKEGEKYLASCEEWETSGEGATMEEAVENLKKETIRYLKIHQPAEIPVSFLRNKAEADIGVYFTYFEVEMNY